MAQNLLLETVKLNVTDGTVMQAYVARASDGQQRRPGIIVLQEAFGVNEHIRDVCGRLAHEGYVAIAPELFHRTAPPGFEMPYDVARDRSHAEAIRPDTLEADLRAAFGWLQSQSFVDRDLIVSVGFCMGGKASFLANAVLPLRASASFYGGGIAPGLLDRASSLNAPILLIWGGKDDRIPVDQRSAVIDALNRNAKTYVNVEFSDAGHGFFCDVRLAYHPLSARQAWPLLLAFLRSYLP